MSKKFLTGKLTAKKKRELHEWKLANEPGYRELTEGVKDRAERIVKARKAGLIAWVEDPNHYRDGAPYCKCGTAEAHNAKHDAVLAGVA